MRDLERVVLLNIIDTKWREHLYEMDYLQEGIHLRSYAQKDPLTEYQREAFDMFAELTERSARTSSATSTAWSSSAPRRSRPSRSGSRTTARRSRAAATRRPRLRKAGNPTR